MVTRDTETKPFKLKAQPIRRAKLSHRVSQRLRAFPPDVPQSLSEIGLLENLPGLVKSSVAQEDPGSLREFREQLPLFA